VVPLSPELEALSVALLFLKVDKTFPWVQTPQRFRKAVVHDKLKDVTVSEFIGHADLKQALWQGHSSPEPKQEPVETSSRIDILSPRPVAGPLDNPMRGDLPRLGEFINEHDQKLRSWI